ncbi:MAG TPA: acetate/propionate family kinase, partial [Thermoanaerobaculia bacterium]|nr:acetate/propionate family kinase [Thermoanaerobaculia bacterium]
GETIRTIGSLREDAHPADRAGTLARFLSAHGSSPSAVAHRIVHGGRRFVQPVLLDASVTRALEELTPLAPLHMPEALAWSRAAGDVLGSAVAQICVFDTAYFADLPKVASTYAIPKGLAERHGIRRFGFHGFAHKALWRRWAELRPDLPGGGRLVSLQLGSGCSAAAIRRGAPLDTSMGFTPIEGLVMSTRSGDLDPGVLLTLQRREGLDPDALERLLDHESGLLGISGSSGDMRKLAAEPENPAARLAIDVFCQRVRKYAGAYLAVLGGVDGIVFGGGIGENSPEVRARCLSGLEPLGIVLDEEANHATIGRDGRISPVRSAIDVEVVVADEAGEMAREAASLLSTSPGRMDGVSP